MNTYNNTDLSIMKITDWFYFVFIVFIFVFLHVGTMMIEQLLDTKTDWGKHKCNPVVMMFSGMFGVDAKANMNECIRMEHNKNMQNSLSGFTQGLSSVASGFTKNIEKLANTRSRLKFMGFANITNFLNIGRQFNAVSFQGQIVMAKLQDTFNKIMGISSGFLYMVDSGHMTYKSLYNGPLGNTFRFLEDQVACFHPETMIELENGTAKQIQYVRIGDKLKNGVKVIATMIIEGNKNNSHINPYYRMYSKQLQTYIYVTGSHHVMKDKHDITVNRHPHAEKMENLETDTFSCLITEDHYIPIGEYLFMDWET